MDREDLSVVPLRRSEIVLKFIVFPFKWLIPSSSSVAAAAAAAIQSFCAHIICHIVASHSYRIPSYLVPSPFPLTKHPQLQMRRIGETISRYSLCMCVGFCSVMGGLSSSLDAFGGCGSYNFTFHLGWWCVAVFRVRPCWLLRPMATKSPPWIATVHHCHSLALATAVAVKVSWSCVYMYLEEWCSSAGSDKCLRTWTGSTALWNNRSPSGREWSACVVPDEPWRLCVCLFVCRPPLLSSGGLLQWFGAVPCDKCGTARRGEGWKVEVCVNC